MRTQGIRLTYFIYTPVAISDLADIATAILWMASRYTELKTGNNWNKQSLEYFELRGRIDDKSEPEGRHECTDTIFFSL